MSVCGLAQGRAYWTRRWTFGFSKGHHVSVQRLYFPRTTLLHEDNSKLLIMQFFGGSPQDTLCLEDVGYTFLRIVINHLYKKHGVTTQIIIHIFTSVRTSDLILNKFFCVQITKKKKYDVYHRCRSLYNLPIYFYLNTRKRDCVRNFETAIQPFKGQNLCIWYRVDKRKFLNFEHELFIHCFRYSTKPATLLSPPQKSFALLWWRKF
jgi:hypothetical protein